MIEEIVLNYLEDSLPVPVYMEMPMDGTVRFALLEKTGSTEENMISSATIVIQSYAESAYEAAVLNEIVKEKMKSIVALDMVLDSKLNSDYRFTDITEKRYRYQAVYNLFY